MPAFLSVLRSRWTTAGVVIVLVAITLTAQRRTPPITPPARRDADDAALLDSLRAADGRNDWVASLVWAERLGARHPRDSGVLLARGTAWSNYGIGARPARAYPRPGVRNSLERTACQIRAIGLADSAARFARSEEEWLAAAEKLGQLQEVQGLPGDALLAYEVMRRRSREEPNGMLRATWLRAMLRDPIHPDTTLYDRRMRLVGLR